MKKENPIIVEVKNLARKERYDEAVALLDNTYGKQLLFAEICILRGALIQLTSEESPYELDEAKAMYEMSLELAPDSDEAMYELGMFHLNVLDNAKVAIEYLSCAENAIKNKLDAVIREINLARAELSENGCESDSQNK